MDRNRFGIYSPRLAHHLAACVLFSIVVFPSAPCRAADLAPGKFLIAARNLGDPNFQESVVLLTHYGEKGALGLIINRPTTITVTRLLPAFKGDNHVYFGGPVQLNGVMALQPGQSGEAQKILPGVYLLVGSDAVEKAAGSSRQHMRIFAGYSGWGPGQLEREIQLGGWHLVAGDHRMVFDQEPESVWRRLIRKAEVVVVRAWAPSRSPHGAPVAP